MKKKNQVSSLGIEIFYAGVEAAFVSRTEMVFHLVMCRKRKGQLEIISQETSLDFASAKKLLKKVSGFYLVITGKPVIHKKLSKFYENQHELVNNLLPDAKANEFASQCTEANGAFHGAVIRREVLQEVLRSFSESRLFPQTVLLGPPVMYASVNFLENNSEFSTSVYQLNLTDGALSFGPVSPENACELEIGNDRLNSLCLTALCSCIQAQSHYPSSSVIDDPDVKKINGEAFQKNRFIKLRALLVILVFTLSISNFFLNRFYSEKYSVLDEQLALNRQRLTEIEKLEKDIDEKRALLGKRPGSNGPVISLIGDRLAASIPSKIRLQTMEIFPVEGKITKEKPIGFLFNKVVIDGTTAESDVLDAWISRCKKFDWVKDVLIVKYSFDREKKKGSFKLEFLLQ